MSAEETESAWIELGIDDAHLETLGFFPTENSEGNDEEVGAFEEADLNSTVTGDGDQAQIDKEEESDDEDN